MMSIFLAAFDTPLGTMPHLPLLDPCLLFLHPMGPPPPPHLGRHLRGGSLGRNRGAAAGKRCQECEDPAAGLNRERPRLGHADANVG